MTEEEARQLFKQYGWAFRAKPRRRGTLYIYAERWGEQQKPIEHYIGPLSRLSEMTEAELIAKLTRLTLCLDRQRPSRSS